jgi:hypothetical protein
MIVVEIGYGYIGAGQQQDQQGPYMVDHLSFIRQLVAIHLAEMDPLLSSLSYKVITLKEKRRYYGLVLYGGDYYWDSLSTLSQGFDIFTRGFKSTGNGLSLKILSFRSGRMEFFLVQAQKPSFM